MVRINEPAGRWAVSYVLQKDVRDSNSARKVAVYAPPHEVVLLLQDTDGWITGRLQTPPEIAAALPQSTAEALAMAQAA